MTLTLSPDIEKALTAAAASTGRKPEELAEETLRAKFGVPVGFVGPRGLELRAKVNAAAPIPAELAADEKERRRQEALARIHGGYFRNGFRQVKNFRPARLGKKRWKKSAGTNEHLCNGLQFIAGLPS